MLIKVGFKMSQLENLHLLLIQQEEEDTVSRELQSVLSSCHVCVHVL